MGRDQHCGDVDTREARGGLARSARRPARYLIGLTGNIAVGKSMVMDILRKLGAHVIDADKVAHQVMASQSQVKNAIVRAFGNHILTPQGQVDRSKLGSIVFKDAEALRQLEQIVHPAVIRAVGELIEQAAESVVVVEAIKLIESGMYRNYDAVWVVTSPVEQQIARLVTQRGLTEKEAILRIEAQSSQAVKLAQADVVIDNSGSLQDLECRVTTEWLKIVHQLAKSAKEGNAL